MITPINTLVERVEPTPLEPYVDEMSFLDEVLGNIEVPEAMT